MRQLSGTDWSMLAADTPTAQNLIAPLSIYDPSTAPGGTVTFDDVLETIESRLHVSETFRERLLTVPLDLDRPYWIKDADFDLEYHVRHLALPEPGDWRQLCTQVSRIGARPLDLTRPPWELYVIEGLNDIARIPSGSFAVLLKMHHAAVDGVAGAELFSALNDLTADPTLPPAAKEWHADRTPSGTDLLRRAALNGVRQPVGAAKTLVPALRSISGTVREMRDPGVDTATRLLTATRFNHDVGPHRVWGSSMTTLSDIKAIRSGIDGVKVTTSLSRSSAER